jgi:hypothetical protein
MGLGSSTAGYKLWTKQTMVRDSIIPATQGLLDARSKPDASVGSSGEHQPAAGASARSVYRSGRVDLDRSGSNRFLRAVEAPR